MRLEELAEALWRERRSPRGGDGPATLPPGAPLDGVAARLAHIESSRSWRSLQRLRRTPLLGLAASLLVPAPAPDADEDPRVRLARILQSRSYRLIRAVKRTPPYRAYARRRYGPDWARPLGPG
jgi:hypothetical protein